MGLRKRIDFFFCHVFIAVKSSFACDDLNMGSDHRAVHACFSVMKYCKTRMRRRRPRRGCLMDPGIKAAYHSALNTKLQHTSVETLTQSEKCIMRSVAEIEAQTSTCLGTTLGPWNYAGFRMSLQQREQCKCAAERARLSKLVQKYLSRHMLQKRNAKLNAILDEFRFAV